MKRINNIKNDFLINLNNEENVYYLGLLWADGYICKSGVIGYSCTKKDFDENFFLKNGIKTFYERQRKKNGKNFGKPLIQVTFTEPKILNFLTSFLNV